MRVPLRHSLCNPLAGRHGRSGLVAMASLVLGLAAASAVAQVSVTAFNTAYTQNFDTLPSSGSATWSNDSTIAGWYHARTGSGTTIVADTGSGTGGNLYSYGASGVAERALGSLGSGNAAAGNFFWGVRLKNDTGGTITSLDVSYTGEQWRNSAAAAQTIAFSYLIGNPSVTGTLAEFQSAGTVVTSLDFTSPITGGTAAALNGNLAANRTLVSHTISGLNIPAGTEIMLRWSDPDHTGTDHGLSIDDFSVTAHGGVAVPGLSINDVSKPEGHSGTTVFNFTVSLSSPAPAGGVTFDIATADGTATVADSDYVARALVGAFIAEGDSSYTFDVNVNGDTTVEPNETFFVNVSNVVAASINVIDGQGQGTIVNDDFPPAPNRIHEIQGSGASTPIGTGIVVTVEGVVTANFQGTNRLSGFFLQEEDADADSDALTSEGVFIYCNSCPTLVAEGQRVRVSGTVSEFFGMTQINATTAAAVAVTGIGNYLSEITPATISLPIVGNIDEYYEAREGMLVRFADTLSVAEYFELSRYGTVELFQGIRPHQFTQTSAPDATGYAAHLAALDRRRVIIDDENNTQNSLLNLADGSQYAYYPRQNGGLSVGTQGTDYFRGGDTVSNLTGVLHWSFAGLAGTDAWRIRPTLATPPVFTVVNPRPATAPDVGGAIRAASVNLLNYFTTIDTTSSSTSGPCGPSQTQDCRGADSVAEFLRQRERTSIAFCGLGADVIGLGELENTTPSDTVNNLLDAVNDRCGGARPYLAVATTGTLGTDAIRVHIIYRSGVVAPFGTPLADMDAIHNRPPLAQTFDVVDTNNAALGQRFTVVASHFKSKGCDGATGGDIDNVDGQGCFSARRTSQAQRLRDWIASAVIPAAGGNDKVLLLGDFNSYAKEPPITTLGAAGYVDLQSDRLGTNAYSYLFDGQLGHLDYALASAALDAHVKGVAAWHINADEVPLFDYNDEIADIGESAFEKKPNGASLAPPRVVYEAGIPYRASDHDPVIVGLFATDVIFRNGFDSGN